MIVYNVPGDLDLSVVEVYEAFPNIEIHGIYFHPSTQLFAFRVGTKIIFKHDEDATAFRLKFGL